MQKVITPEILEKAMSYASYRQLLDSLLTIGKTTGFDQSESKLNYARLNEQRMRKWEKIGKLKPELQSKLLSIDRPMVWLIITEGWCGDAAQTLPFVQRMAEINPLITIKVILRDEHPDIMNQFLTQGSRSIPKIIALNPDDLSILGDWGPRPGIIQNEFLENKATQARSGKEFTEYMHLWYAKNKGTALQSDFLVILDVWKIKQQSLPVQAG